jgi:hypothetical protein
MMRKNNKQKIKNKNQKINRKKNRKKPIDTCNTYQVSSLPSQGQQ